jgi:CheY-specific phosphatase CheX
MSNATKAGTDSETGGANAESCFWSNPPMNVQEVQRLFPLGQNSVQRHQIYMSAPKSIEPKSVLPKSEWLGILSETAMEVFSIMVGVNASIGMGDQARVAPQVTGMIGIAGAMRANFILECSSAAAVRLASQMLGISADDPNCEKAACDALGEVCNVVAGYFKAKVGLGDTCKLSVPTIIMGSDYQFHTTQAFERMVLPVIYEGETMWATLEIAQ